MIPGQILAADHRLRQLLAAEPLGGAMACERDLERHFIGHSSILLPGFPYLVMREWDVNPGASQFGVGDLVFTDGQQRYAVVELKFLNSASGRTARTSRRKGRRAVSEQPVWYGKRLFQRIPEAQIVNCYSYTNDRLEAAVLEGVLVPGPSGEPLLRSGPDA